METTEINNARFIKVLRDDRSAPGTDPLGVILPYTFIIGSSSCVMDLRGYPACLKGLYLSDCIHVGVTVSQHQTHMVYTLNP